MSARSPFSIVNSQWHSGYPAPAGGKVGRPAEKVEVMLSGPYNDLLLIGALFVFGLMLLPLSVVRLRSSPVDRHPPIR